MTFMLPSLSLTTSVWDTTDSGVAPLNPSTGVHTEGPMMPPA